MTQIKVCGITRVEDALECAALGADFLGLIFVPSSPRCVGVETARQIVAATRKKYPKEPLFVGVFRDHDPEHIRRVASYVGFDAVQLHGDESDADIVAIGMPTIKAFPVRDGLPDTWKHPRAAWDLFDTRDDALGGGTGRQFDWSVLSQHTPTRPFFLAGGLNADNVADAIRVVKPDVVDVSSGVESRPGIKDPQKLRAFFDRVRNA